MADSSSGRNEFNAGSDSAIHHRKGSAFEQHEATPKTERSTPVQGPGGSSIVGTGKPPKADERSAVK